MSTQTPSETPLSSIKLREVPKSKATRRRIRYSEKLSSVYCEMQDKDEDAYISVLLKRLTDLDADKDQCIEILLKRIKWLEEFRTLAILSIEREYQEDPDIDSDSDDD